MASVSGIRYYLLKWAITQLWPLKCIKMRAPAFWRSPGHKGEGAGTGKNMLMLHGIFEEALKSANTFEVWAKKILESCLKNGKVELHEIPAIIGTMIHPNHAAQLLSWIARLNPDKCYYEDQTLYAKKRGGAAP